MKNILIEYPKNKNIKFLFTSYPTQELTGRDRVVKEQLKLPTEGVKDVFVVVETDLTDLPDSLQQILKENIGIDDSDTVIFRAFYDTKEKLLLSENDMDVYNLVYSEFEWGKKSPNKSLN